MLQDLKSIINKTVKNTAINDQLQYTRIVEEFQKEANIILGTEPAGKIKPLYLKEGILTVASLSVFPIHELQLQEAEILAKINEKLGKVLIKEVKYLT